MKQKKQILSHMMAFLSVAVWGTTFVSTKVLLDEFEPIEIAIIRFILALIFLNIMKPQRLHVRNWKKECYFIAAGVTGVTLYFLTENIALTYTTAANVGVIISTVPFFTGIVTVLFFGGKKLSKRFVLGFIVAITGIAAISFHGASELSLNPMGDILTIIAALTWAFYSNIVNKIGEWNYPMIQVTRRIFFYGLIFLLPATLVFPISWDMSKFSNPIYLCNLLYLGIGASAICFVTWNIALRTLGTVKTTVYLYLSPVFTMVASTIVLQEPITWVTLIGAGLTTAGLLISGKD